MSITACSFIYNEEKNIGECLKNISPYVDEILLVDMDSTDKTAEIAYNFTHDIFRKPHLICGDQYKDFLAHTAKSDWLLWVYPDERFSEKFLSDMKKFTDSDNFDAYAVMRHEYRDDIRLMPHGTTASPNYQNRLHRKGKGIFYTELVHAELHGRHRDCFLPEEYFMEHRKGNTEQEYDNWRTYIELKFLVSKYRNTNVEPYRTYIKSYQKIIFDSEAKNFSGERMIHPVEEFFWNWEKFKDKKRITVQQFECEFGISYKKFVEENKV